MKKTFFALIAVIVPLMFWACGGQPEANKPTVAPAGNTVAVPAATQNTTEMEVKNLVSLASRSHIGNNLSELEKIYAENCMLVKSNGKKEEKAGCLAAMKTGGVVYEFYSYDQVGVQVNTEGTGAVVTARATTRGKTNGKPFSTQFREKQTWSKIGDSWKITGVEPTEFVELPIVATQKDDSKDNDPKAIGQPPAKK